MMNNRHSPSTLCPAALAALEKNPLDLPASVEAHLRGCPACSEAQVLWLALEEAPEGEAPAGYFEGLGFRILRKLPTRRGGLRRSAAFWLAAAGLLAALGLGATGFFLGRAMRAPLVEASQPKGWVEALDPQTETPFVDAEDPLTQLTNLSPRQAEAALARLQAPAPSAPGE
jgi:hypothetical protein